MAVPKRRTSKRKKRARRTHYKAVRPTLQACPRCGHEAASPRLPDVRVLQRRAADNRRGLMIRIALDAMGSDNAPQVEVEGAAQALKELPAEFQIQLVGRKADIEAALAKLAGVDRTRIEIVDAPEVVGMGDKPLAAIRGKPRSSIAVGLDLQKKHKSDAFISAGNTGAVMAASTLLLRLVPGVQRAAIGALFPSAGQPVLVVDGGANVEGRDIPVGEARGQPLDVVACDGFVGNVVLKFYESAGRVFVSLIKREAPDVLLRPEMGNVLKVLDYATYGGAPLLGVQGVVIICHGSSPAKAIKNAIRVAGQAVRSHLSDDIAAEFAEGKVPA